MTICYEDDFEIYVPMVGKIIFNALCLSSSHCGAKNNHKATRGSLD